MVLNQRQTRSKIPIHCNNHKIVTTMKNYLKPEIDIHFVVAERGYGDSVGLPGFGTENDELVY
jgi:hypothetical protein